MTDRSVPSTLRQWLTDAPRPVPTLASCMMRHRPVDLRRAVAWANMSSLALVRERLPLQARALLTLTIELVSERASDEEAIWRLLSDSQVNLVRLASADSDAEELLATAYDLVLTAEADRAPGWLLPCDLKRAEPALKRRVRLQLLSAHTEIQANRLWRSSSLDALRDFAQNVVDQWPTACGSGMTEPLEVLSHCEGVKLPPLSSRLSPDARARTELILRIQSALSQVRRDPNSSRQELWAARDDMLRHPYLFSYATTLAAISRAVREAGRTGDDELALRHPVGLSGDGSPEIAGELIHRIHESLMHAPMPKGAP